MSKNPSAHASNATLIGSTGASVPTGVRSGRSRAPSRRRRLILALTLITLVALATANLVAPPEAVAEQVTFLGKWGSYGAGDGQFSGPFGVAVAPDGTVYVADTFSHRIQHFSATGAFLGKWGSYGAGDGQFNWPYGVAVAPDGTVYVADMHNHRIQHFSATGAFLGKWGSLGAGDGQFNVPRGVAVAPDGTVYVADTDNHRIQHFSATGAFLGKWGSVGVGDGQFNNPCGVAVAPGSTVYVADTDNQRMQYFSATGAFLGKWGSYGSGDGEFKGPYGVAVAADGTVYVADRDNRRIQHFSTARAFLGQWGSLGSGDGQFSTPYRVAVAPDGTVYVADTDSNRIQYFSVVAAPAELVQVSVAGASRIGTAIEASRLAFPVGSDYVVIATAYNWPDALGGSALAGALDAPILLTPAGSLPAEVAAEITRLGATNAVILGGTGAVSLTVESALNALVGEPNVDRIGGMSRYDTANLIAARTIQVMEAGTGYDGTAFVATGANFPDALGASPLAAKNKWPIYLANPAQGNNAALVSIMDGAGVTKAIVLGGTGVVAPEVQAKLADLGSVTRLAGLSRYDTAVIVATYGVQSAGLSWDKVAIATGQNFPDALAGGVLQANSGSVMLLTHTAYLDTVVADKLTAEAAGIFEVRFLGGTGAVSTAVRTSVVSILQK